MAKKFFIAKKVIIPKKVIVGIDFGTSFTKVYYNQEGDKETLQFTVKGELSYYYPTQLFYNSKNNKIYFERQPDTETLKYFKYSMINDGLLTSQTLRQNNNYDSVKPEFLCSIYYLANLIKIINKQISGILKTSEIEYHFNMGCPIDNFDDKNKGVYDEVLSLGYALSDSVEDGIDFKDLYDFYVKNKDKKFNNLQTVPELYAEALWFIEQPSIEDGLYTILDIGGGTVDCATLYIYRSEDHVKKIRIYSQSIMPLGIEILLQYMFPNDYEEKRKDCLNQLKKTEVKMPFGWDKKFEKDRELLKAHEFDVNIATVIAETKERDAKLMEKQYKAKGEIPYFTFGGGAFFEWYHSIIKSDAFTHKHKNAGIPEMIKQRVILNDIPSGRLIIAEQLTRSTFPEIEGFPWDFDPTPFFSALHKKD